MEKSMPQPKGMPEIASPLLVEASILLELPVVSWFPVGHNPESDTQVTARFSSGGSVFRNFLCARSG